MAAPPQRGRNLEQVGFRPTPSSQMIMDEQQFHRRESLGFMRGQLTRARPVSVVGDDPQTPRAVPTGVATYDESPDAPLRPPPDGVQMTPAIRSRPPRAAPACGRNPWRRRS